MTLPRIIPIWLFILSGWSAFIPAQSLTHRFQRLGVEDGLSMASITDVIQDKQGLIWMATQNGANVYNGYEIKQHFHDSQNEHTLRENYVRQFALDGLGRLWLATLSGVDRFDPVSGHFIHYTLPKGTFMTAASQAVTAICTGNGELFVGTLERGLFRYDKVSDAFVQLATELQPVDMKHETITTMALDRENRLWIATTRSRLLLWQDGQEKATLHHHLNDKLPNKPIESIAFSRDDTILLGYERAGLVVVDDQGNVTHFQNDPNNRFSLPSNDVLDIHISSNGVVWLGTGNGLAHMRDDGRFYNHFFDPQNNTSLSDNRVFRLFEDRGGVMWIATNNGVCRMKVTNEVVHLYQQGSAKNSLSHNRIKALYGDDDDTLWIGTFGGGLNRLDLENDEIIAYRHDPHNSTTISSDNVFALDRIGDVLYVGTFGGGLNAFDTKTGRFSQLDQPRHKPEDDRILKLHAEREDRLWVGTWMGLDLYNPQTNTTQQIATDIENDYNLANTTVREVYPDASGRIWVGSFGNGLYLYNHDQRTVKNWRNIPGDETSLAQDRVLSIAEDAQNRLWVGTLGGGLHRFFPETGTFRRVVLGESNGYNVIVSILIDEKGMLWMATYSGILRFDPQNESLMCFSVSDGLQGLEFNTGAYDKLADGQLAFGGTQGLNIFSPNELKAIPYRPPVMLTGFQIYNHDAPLEGPDGPLKEIQVDFDKKVLSFEYAALDYADPQGVDYAYMLEGFDQSWQEVGNRRHVTYTNLSPGSYQFRVKAASSAGVWNEEGTSLVLKVIPPFYMRTWFYLLIGFIALAWVRYWTWSNKRQRRILQNRVDERTRDLRETNLRLADTIRELEETAGELRKTQAKVAESAHRAGMAEIATDVLHAIGNTMNSLLVSTETVHNTIQKLPGQFLVNIADLLDENHDQLGPFFDTSRGKRLASTLRSLGSLLVIKGNQTLKEIQSINECCFQISGILNSQRQYAFDDDFLEEMDIRNVVDDVLRFQSASLTELNIQVNRHYEHVPRVLISKSRLIHILNHLIRNACDALKEGKSRDDRWVNIWIRNQTRNGKVLLEIRDNGSGIKALDLETIFAQGFTTKKGASGYGLHYCMLSITNMGGKIRAESQGEGAGACFFIEVPIRQVRRRQESDVISVSV